MVDKDNDDEKHALCPCCLAIYLLVTVWGLDVNEVEWGWFQLGHFSYH